MIGPHYDSLANTYVEVMGMEPFLYERPHGVAVWVGEQATKPVTMRAFDLAVVYNHMLYFRTPCGLAWEPDHVAGKFLASIRPTL